METLEELFLKKRSTKDSIKEIYNRKSLYLVKTNSYLNEAKNILKKKNIPLIPIINKNKKIIDYVSNKKRNKTSNNKINTEVIIMAGGEGTRLRPLTNILPKPLIPLNNKTVIESIIEHFTNFNINKFIISINYKSDLIKSFLRSFNQVISLNLFKKKKPLGTAGSLGYIDPAQKKDYIVTNCDTLIDFDCADFFDFHKKNKNDITILVSSKQFKVPYGVCKINRKGNLIDISEKPSEHYLVNTGIYIVNNSILKFVKKEKYLDFDELIMIAKKNKKKISIFPVSENSWFDTGQWDEYLKAKKIMINGKKVLAIIPARKSSEELKNKNIRKFNKKPLIFWTLKAAKKSKLIDEVVVSSNSNKI